MAHSQRRNAKVTIRRKSATLSTESTLFGPVECYIGDPSGLSNQSQFLASVGLIQGSSNDVTDQILFDVTRSHALITLQENDELTITEGETHKNGVYYLKGTARPIVPANQSLPAKYKCNVRRKPD